MNENKCKCGNEIHSVRIKRGHNNCVACSENYYWEKKAENFIKTGSYYG